MRHIHTVIRAADAAGPGIRRLILMDPDGWPLPKFRPGAHIHLHLLGGLVRSYSLCGDPAQQDRYVIAVKREEAGRGGSAFLHDRAAAPRPDLAALLGSLAPAATPIAVALSA